MLPGGEADGVRYRMDDVNLLVAPARKPGLSARQCRTDWLLGQAAVFSIWRSACSMRLSQECSSDRPTS